MGKEPTTFDRYTLTDPKEIVVRSISKRRKKFFMVSVKTANAGDQTHHMSAQDLRYFSERGVSVTGGETHKSVGSAHYKSVGSAHYG